MMSLMILQAAAGAAIGKAGAAIGAGLAVIGAGLGIGKIGQASNEDREQCDTFDERTDDDGCHTVVVRLFRLTGTRLEGSLTDFTNSHSCTDNCETCADCSSGFSDGCTCSRLENHK